MKLKLPTLRIRLPAAWTAPLYARWDALPAPARQYIKLGSLVLVPVILYLALWVPMQRQVTSMRAKIPQAREQLALMRVQAVQVSQLRATTPTSTTPISNLPAFVEQLATTHGLKGNVRKLEPAGKNGVQVAVENVSFNGLLSFLGDLQKQAAISIENAAFDAQTTPGMVNAQLTLRTAGP
jgi:general secretion pathway protein M